MIQITEVTNNPITNRSTGESKMRATRDKPDCRTAGDTAIA